MSESAISSSPSGPASEPSTQHPISTKPLVTERTRRVAAIVSVTVLVVVLVVLITVGYWLFTAYNVPPDIVPATVRLRDMSIILIAVESLVLLMLALIIAVLLFILIVLVYDRIIPALEQMNRTINTVADTAYTVRGTTTFVSDRIVTPFITVASYAAGVARIGKGIVDLWPRSKRSGNGQEPPAPGE